jgi:hypothetical protein
MKWTALGIDLLLGIGADMPMDNMESMFLPDFLMKGISSATVDNVKLESDKIIQVKDLQSIPLQSSFFVTPLFIISLLSFLLLIPSFGFIKNTTLGLLADRILFISTGLLGIFLLFMWLGTDHESFSKNINLIWAFPLNIFFSFRLNAVNKRMQQFFKIWSLMILILIAVSLSFLGMINMALYPLMLLMSYRYWMLSKK